MKHTISGLVKNRAGILAQVMGAFKKFDVNALNFVGIRALARSGRVALRCADEV